ncbi:TRAP transporter small permease subunit [Alkalimarinus alittae]|uniref:TRAP transporter small permease protein n=1 Tax=Alkalimarinus alittae TaxID=2961619 RepID=A0ABY6N102_9ALTE|nr:TRAP transporter small permease subunit [Alkalimarinus alittae]UZE95710.1 TRAP transporter small permease subunit [Alkalimarinus alittae]
MAFSNTLLKTIHAIDQFTEHTGRTISWLNIAMVVLTCLTVIMRYVFNHSSIIAQESIMYLHASIFLIASAYTLKHDEHVRVDIFYHRLSPKAKATVNLLGTILLLIPVIGFIGWSSWPYIESSWRIYETSQEAAGVPLVYLLKSLILAMVAVMLLQALAEILRSITILTGIEVEHSAKHEGAL